MEKVSGLGDLGPLMPGLSSSCNVDVILTLDNFAHRLCGFQQVNSFILFASSDRSSLRYPSTESLFRSARTSCNTSVHPYALKILINCSALWIITEPLHCTLYSGTTAYRTLSGGVWIMSDDLNVYRMIWPELMYIRVVRGDINFEILRDPLDFLFLIDP